MAANPAQSLRVQLGAHPANRARSALCVALLHGATALTLGGCSLDWSAKPERAREDASVDDAGSDAASASPDVAVFAEGQACAEQGERGCTSFDSTSTLRCTQGTWAAATPCADAERCDTRLGSTQGQCLEVVPECRDKAPGDSFCRGGEQLSCGPDRVTAEPGTADAADAGPCGPSGPVDVDAPPDGPAGRALVDLRGGAGLLGLSGGYGGGFSAQGLQGQEQCIPEVIHIFPTGSVDASFEVPEVSLDLGAEPMVVTTNGTLKSAYETLNEGDFYYDDQLAVVRRFMAAGSPVVSGMRVAAGVSFVIPNNASPTFLRDVEILGTVQNQTTEVNFLSLSARNLVVGKNGSIEVPQNLAGSGLALKAEGVLSLRGKLAANGAVSGAPGGPVKLSAGGRIYLDGQIDVSGGDSSTNGGAGGSVQAFAGTAGLWNAATIDASGGEGGSVGGTGGQIVLGADRANPANATLDLRNTGTLDVSGGAQTACGDAVCSGGQGGSIELVALGAPLRSSGALKARGGKSQLAAGSGGSLRLAILPGRDQVRPANVGLEVAGSLSAPGGAATSAGGNAGSGGTVYFHNCTGQGSSADFLGYAHIQLGGGATSTTGVDGTGPSGGGGGYFTVVADQEGPRARRLYLYVPIEARGGDGYSSGPGGTMAINLSAARSDAVLPEQGPTLVLAAASQFGGGQSGEGGGSFGGTLTLQALGSISIPGSLSVSAGPTRSENPSGGGVSELVSVLGSIALDGELHSDGGDGLVHGGGNGGCIALDARTLAIAGSATALGGDAAQDSSSAGGSGGTISYVSHDAAASISGSVDVSGGSGTPAGERGKAGGDIPNCFRGQ